MKTLFFSATVIFTFLIIISGCSGKSPVTNDSESIISADISVPAVLISDRSKCGNAIGGSGLLGVFHVVVDLENGVSNLSPYRFATGSQDVLEVVDITNFMLMTPCLDCVKIRSVSLNDESNIEVSIGIKHPFPAPDRNLPPTAQNRADLHVFNVEGIVYSITESADLTNFSTIGEASYPPFLMNADGYTGYLSNSLGLIRESDASIHPYILHFTDYTSGNFSRNNEFGFEDIVYPLGYHVMKQGSGWDFRNYEFNPGNLSTGKFEFLYTIGCTFGISAANRWARLTPVYKLPQFNKKAATKVWVSNMVENPPAGLQGGQVSSSNTIEISILDMNHQVPIGTELDRMKFTSDIASITIEIPSVLSSVVHQNSPVPLGGNPRDPNDPLRYEFTIQNQLGAAEGTYTGLVKVADSYPTLSNEGIEGDGISRVEPFAPPTDGLFNIPEFATYYVFTVDVGTPNLYPVACFQVTPDHFDPPEKMPVSFNGSCSYDDDSSIILYEWDFNYDGSVFNVDDTGVEVEFVYDTAGDFTIALRVTDDGIPQLSNVTTQDITVVEVFELQFEANRQILSGIQGEVIPVGLHYADSKDDTIYVSIADADYNIKSIRSNDGGDLFVSPAHTVNTTPNDQNLVGISTRMTKSSHIDVMWLYTPGFTGYLIHSKAYSGYSFISENLVDEPNFAFVVSHDVSSDDTIFASVIFMYSSPPDYFFEAGLYISNDNGSSWNTQNGGDPIRVSESCGDELSNNVSSVTICADEQGNAHIFYIDDLSGSIRYTIASNNASSFTDYQTVAIFSSPISVPFHSLSADVSDNGKNVYLAYKSKAGSVTNIHLVKSHDYGETFCDPITINSVSGEYDKPCLTIDPYGWIYVVYLDITSDDVLFTYSKDMGDTWEPSVLVNDDDNPLVKHKSPTITVDSDLRIHIFWRDSRNSSNPGNPAAGDYGLIYTRGTWL